MLKIGINQYDNIVYFLTGSKGKESADQFKSKIVRYSLLSWTMLMCQVGKQFQKLYGTQEAIIRKGLATEKEMEKLNKNDNTSMGWLDKWWVPLNWCCRMIRIEIHKEGGHLTG